MIRLDPTYAAPSNLKCSMSTLALSPSVYLVNSKCTCTDQTWNMGNIYYMRLHYKSGFICTPSVLRAFFIPTVCVLLAHYISHAYFLHTSCIFNAHWMRTLCLLPNLDSAQKLFQFFNSMCLGTCMYIYLALFLFPKCV